MENAGARTLRTAERRAVVACCLAMAACGGAETTLAVHSSLPPEVTEAAEDAFEAAHPGVDVRVVSEPASKTLERLRSGEDPGPDVWWGAPGHVLERAAGEGLLAMHRAAWSVDAALLGAGEAKPGAGGSPTGAGDPQPGDADPPTGAADPTPADGAPAAGPGRPWHPSLVSPFVIAFNGDSLSLGRAPRDWIDLFHFRFRGDLALVDPTRSEESALYLAAMVVERLRQGRDLVAAFDWLLRLDASVDVYAPGARELLEDVRAGRTLVTVLPRHVAEQARHEGASWLRYRFAESGAPVLVRGIAVVAASRRPDLAGAFVDLTGTSEVVRAARLHMRWAAAQAGPSSQVDLPEDFELPLPWSPRPLAADTVAAELEGWLQRWQAEVRGRGDRYF